MSVGALILGAVAPFSRFLSSQLNNEKQKYYYKSACWGEIAREITGKSLLHVIKLAFKGTCRGQ